MKPSAKETSKGLALFVLLVVAGAALGWLIIPTPGRESPSRRNPLAEESILTAAHGGGRVETVGGATFARQVLGSPVPVLVDFHADWCAPCVALAPVLDELAREIPNVKIVKVNVDHDTALADRYDVSSIPRLLVFKNGQIAADHTGSASKARLKSMLGL